MDNLKGKIAGLSPARRALLEQRMQGEKNRPVNQAAAASTLQELSPPVIFRSDGKGTPLVLFHYFSSSQLLAKYLGSERPVYAVDGGFDADLHQWEQSGQSDVTVEMLAERCVAQLKLAQPHGPYFLGGFCFGGTLAFEAASQLVRQGEPVAFLGLMDAFYTLELDTAPMVMEDAADHARANIADVKKSSASRIAFMRELLVKYKSLSYPGDAVLFRAMEGRSASDKSANGWEEVVTGNIHLEDCQTIRAKFFDQPVVYDLVAKLARSLAAADAGIQSSTSVDQANSAPESDAPVSQVEFVPPGTPTEIILTRILRDILKLKQVGIHDNFFELGGDSLLAVRLISQIKKSLGFELPIPVFFQNPTIQQLAAVLDEENQQKREPKLIQLQSGGAAGTLYLLDVSMGLCRLAEQLKDTDLDIFGTVVPLSHDVFEAAARDEWDKLPTLEEMAAAHTALIQSHQPSGPILLGGHSFGGSMSFEVAHQLQQAGRPVEMIFLLDSWAGIPPWWKRIRALTLARAKESLLFRAGHLWSRTRKKMSGRNSMSFGNPNPGEASGSNFGEVNRPVGDVPWEIWEKIYIKAGDEYSYRPVPSRGILFRTQHSDKAHLYAVYPDLGWGRLFQQGFQMVEVPGDHFSLLKDPEVLTLARRFKECLHERRPGPIESAVPLREDKPRATPVL
jgi:thioesterase domain-containing protein/acyl carrier protein